MKPEELMIGDWVLLDGEPYQIRQLGIFGENRDGEDYPAVCVGKPKGIGLIIERNEIEPIELNDDILEKNEFFYESNVGQVWNDGEYEVIVDFYNGEIRVIKNRKEILSLEYFDKIYVHNLQHALKICEVNKNIKL